LQKPATTATAKNCPRLVGKSYRKIAVASKVVRPEGTIGGKIK